MPNVKGKTCKGVTDNDNPQIFYNWLRSVSLRPHQTESANNGSTEIKRRLIQ